MFINPLHNNIVIKQDDKPIEGRGSIIVADLGKEKPLHGIVVAVGLGIYTINGVWIPTNIKKGQRVLFPAFGGVRVTIEGEEYIISKETDILAILSEEEIKENELPF